MKTRALSLLLVLVMLLGLLPTAVLAADEQINGLSRLAIKVGSTIIDTDSDIGGFTSNKLTYDFDAMLGASAETKIRAVADEYDATMTLQVNGGEVIELQRNRYKTFTGVDYGQNVLKLTVSYGDVETVYTFNVNCIARAELDSPAATDPATGMRYYLYTAQENGEKVFSTSYKQLKDYWMFIPETVTTLTLNAQAAAEGDTVTYNGSAETSVDVSATDKIDVRTVHGEKSDYTWTIHLVKQEAATVVFDVPAGANVRVWDSDKVTYNPQADGLTYAGLTKRASYNYVVVKDGFVSVNGTFVPGELTDGKVSVTMEAVPASTHKNYSGEWTSFRGSDDNMAIRSALTPTTTNEVHLKWAVKMGTDMWQSPTPPIILNDVEVDGKTHDVLICAMAKKIYLLDKETGETLKSAPMAGSAGFATNPLTYGDGLVFVQLDNQIQAFDAATLESVWLSEAIVGQTISPITYYKGHIYIGTWQGETYDGTFACFSVADEKPTETNETKYAKWTLTHKGGFYWAGAYATDNYVVFGSDDGSEPDNYTETAVLYSVNPETGAVIDKIEGVKGDIRSTVAYYDGACYAVTKGGLFLKAPIDSTGHFDHNGFQTVELGNMCTSTPIIYNGRAFIGTSGAQQFYSPGTLNVIDVKTMQVVKNVTLPGYPQAPMLMSTGYEADTGKVLIYTTYNAPPGGIYCVTWDTKADTYEVEHIYVPEKTMQQYCLGSPICDSKGTIYYKNDSGYLFALSKTDLYGTGISVDGAAVSGFAPDKTAYRQTVSAESVKVSATGCAGSTVEIVCGEQSAANELQIAIPEGDTEVQIVIRKGEASKTYTLTLHKASDATGLEKLYVNTSDDSTDETYVPTPVYSDDVAEYFLYDVPADVNTLYLHAIASQAGMKGAMGYLVTPEQYWKPGQGLNGSKIDDTHFSFRLDFNKGADTHISDHVIRSEKGNAERRFRFTATHLSKAAYENQGKILGFSIGGQFGTIDEAAKTIQLNLTIPSNEMAKWNLKALSPDVSIAGKSVAPASGAAQDFTNPVQYTVTNADGTTSTYTVTVTMTAGPSSDTGIKSLTVAGQKAVKQPDKIYDTFNNAYEYFKVTLPYGVAVPTEKDALEIVTSAEDATVTTSYNAKNVRWSVRVTAPNKNSQTYYVLFTTQDTPSTITFDANGGTCATTSMQVGEGGKLASLPKATKAGEVFDGWYTEQHGGKKVTTETVFTEDASLYAHWVLGIEPTDKETVTVYFSLSEDGKYVTSDATGTTLAQMPVTLTYFDLAEYGLQAFYRTDAEGRVVIRPAVLHLFIRMLEEQYLAGYTDKLVVGETQLPGAKCKAMSISGSATSLYMPNFWGHDENLLYYVNHQYPLMSAGWGSTADWILLDDNDVIEVAMFSDWNFWTDENAGFRLFQKNGKAADQLTVMQAEALNVTLGRVTADMNGGSNIVAEPNRQIYYTANLDTAGGDVSSWTPLGKTDANGLLTAALPETGTFYIGAAGDTVSTPAICKVTVTENPAIGDVIARIDAIGEVTKDSGAAIRAARDAYNALSESEKALIPAESVKKLVEAEKKYAELTRPATPVGTPTQNSQNENASGLPFADVLPGSWYFDGVKYVYANSLMNGTSTDKFSPEATLTRGMVVTILYRMEHEPAISSGMTFSDVAAGRYYSDAVAWASANGIVEGFTDGTFKPEKAVTREQLAAILSRYAKFQGKTVPETELPAGVTASNWAKADAAWAYGSGILNAAQGSNAAANANRAEVAMAIYAYLNK